MCDTIVALGSVTEDGSVLFAKNSDRDPNEAHELCLIPGGKHELGSTVKCTYITIPQVERTHTVLLAKPFWIWGAEMGTNDQGVAIGNEAVFSKEPYGKEPGLIGMDFLRLALERSSTSLEALRVITGLLEKYGQSGNCGYAHPLYYHNSFLIADRQEAWVLETAGKQWVAEKVKDIRTISNLYTIQGEWDLASNDLVDYAVDRKWCKNKAEFNFAASYSDFIYTTFADGRKRQCFTSSSLNQNKGRISVKTMLSLLRAHEADIPGGWSPDKGVFGQDVCAHAGFGPVRISQTTGSMISSLSDEGDIHLLTGTSTPCTSIFKPVWLEAGLPDTGVTPGKDFDSSSLWWRHELLQREVQRSYDTRIASYSSDRDALENKFVQAAWELRKNPIDQKKALSERCFMESNEAENTWLEIVRNIPVEKKMAFYHAIAWNRFNSYSGIPINY